jgi:peptidoglycan/xylan/chitin deacetylase (PgdA/CDA1 family)
VPDQSGTIFPRSGAVTIRKSVVVKAPFLFLAASCCVTWLSHASAPDCATCEQHLGGIVRGPRHAKQIALVFTGHEFAEGAPTILDELKTHQAKAAFFLTGHFLAANAFTNLVQRMIGEGHQLGPHSDGHLLYCSWGAERRTLVSHEQFRADLGANLDKLETAGVARKQVRYLLPPYEHYNQQIVAWAEEQQLRLINYSPGTRSAADYTGEADKNFVSSQAIFDSIVAKERQDPDGLNGFVLLLHLGAGPGRADKFHLRFGELLDYLAGKGYRFVRLDDWFRTP